MTLFDSRPSASTLVRLFLASVAVVTVLRIAALVATPIDLHGDEAQYWMWSRALDWGYFSKPPLIAWVIAATTSVFGNAEWAVRLAAPIAHAGAAAALFALGRRMAGVEAGVWAGLAWLLMPGVWLSSALISTDALLLPAWATALWATWRFVETGSWRWAAAMGAAIGIGLLAKYAMSYFAIGLAVAAIWSPEVRRALFSRPALAALAAALAFIAPNLLWNAQNQFATIEHTAANANWSGSIGDPAAAAAFLVDQLGVAGPILFPLALWCAWRAVRTAGGWRAVDPRFKFLIAFAAPPLVIILVQAFISRAHGNWAATAYPAAIALVAVWAFGRGAVTPRLRAAAAGIAGLHAVFGGLFLAAMVSAPFADAIGLGNGLKRAREWEETAALVRARAAAGTPEGPFTAVMVDNRLVFNDLSYYFRDSAPAAPLRMWVLLDKPANQAERTAPMRVEDGARVLIVGATPSYEPWIAADFRSVSPIERIGIPLGGGRERALSFRVGVGFAPATRDAAYLDAIRSRPE